MTDEIRALLLGWLELCSDVGHPITDIYELRKRTQELLEASEGKAA